MYMVLFTFSNVTKLSNILISTLKACRCLRNTRVLHCAMLGRWTRSLRTGRNNSRKALIPCASYACRRYTLPAMLLYLVDTVVPDIIDPDMQKQDWKIHLLYICWGASGSHTCWKMELECWGTLPVSELTMKIPTASLNHWFQSYCCCSFDKVRGFK